MDGIDAFPLDYRVTSSIQDKCSTMYDVREHLQKNYAQNITVEFSHVKDEKERIWLYDQYEKAMAEEVNEAEQIKALQLLLRTE